MAFYQRLFQTLLRVVSIMLDWVVYTCVRIFSNLFYVISHVQLFQGATLSDSETSVGASFITEITERLYVLIGVYALFKITFVLINMMVNPSDGSKGEKSIGKIATRIFVMLALIIAVPTIFNYAYAIQNAIVDENVIGKIILPDMYQGSGNSMTEGEGIGDRGHMISNQIFSSFLSISPEAMAEGVEIESATDIDPETVLNDDAKNKCAESVQALISVYGATDINDTNVGVATMISPVTEVFENSETGKDEFCLDYQFFLSTIAGGFAAFIFAIYCIDLGLRVIKLAFYELVAPIPIVSYIDGKKDGPFQKWMKDAGKTYADIFIRIAIINLILLLITNAKLITELTTFPESLNVDFATGLFAKAAIILGSLMFAKQAPQLFLDLFGIKAGNTFSFSPKAAQEKIAGGIGGTAILAGAGAAGAAAGTVAGMAGKVAGGTAGALAKGVFNKKGLSERGKIIKDNLNQSFKSAGIRGKAGVVETLARANKSNYNDKGVYNRQVSARNLTRQALTGNINATAGIGGRLASAQTKLTSSLTFQTSAHKSSALKSTGTIGAQLGNVTSTLNAQRLQLEEQAKRGDAAALSQLKIATDFNAKAVFENYLRSVNIDETFQKIPKVNDDAAWSQYVKDFMGFADQDVLHQVDKDGNRIADTHALTQAEKEALKTYAEKALGDLKKEVDTLTKNK